MMAAASLIFTFTMICLLARANANDQDGFLGQDVPENGLQYQWIWMWKNSNASGGGFKQYPLYTELGGECVSTPDGTDMHVSYVSPSLFFS